MWLPLTCPNVATLEARCCSITEHLPLPTPPAHLSSTLSTTGPSAPAACQHLQALTIYLRYPLGSDALTQPQAQHLQQQLAALPSLSRLSFWEGRDLAAELHSTSVTRLRFECEQDDELPHAL